MRNVVTFPLVVLLVTLATAVPAAANEPLFMLPTMLSLPLMAALHTTGVSVLWVTLLEFGVLMWGQRLKAGRALLLAAGANLYSTLFGFFLAVGAFIPLLLLPVLILAALYLSRMLGAMAGRKGGPFSAGAVLGFVAMFALCLGSAWSALLFPKEPAQATVLLFTTGFALTFVLEGGFLARDLAPDRPRWGVMKTTFWMNVLSYAVLAATSGSALYQQALKQTGATLRTRSGTRACVANMGAIQAAKEEWAFVHRAKLAQRFGPLPPGAGKKEVLRLLADAEPSWSDLVPAHLKLVPVCYVGGTYTIGRVGQLPACSRNHPDLHPVTVELEEMMERRRRGAL